MQVMKSGSDINNIILTNNDIPNLTKEVLHEGDTNIDPWAAHHRTEGFW